MHRAHLQELRGLVLTLHDVAKDNLVLDTRLGEKTCRQKAHKSRTVQLPTNDGRARLLTLTRTFSPARGQRKSARLEGTRTTRTSLRLIIKSKTPTADQRRDACPIFGGDIACTVSAAERGERQTDGGEDVAGDLHAMDLDGHDCAL